MTPSSRHPLAPVDAEEIRAARRIVFDSGRLAIPTEQVRFAYVGLCDPPKALVHAYDRGEAVVVDRRLRLVLLQGPEAEVV
jgi:primary-amine oxidase